MAAKEDESSGSEKDHGRPRVSHEEVVWSNEKAVAETAVAVG